MKLPLVPREGLEEAQCYFSSPSRPVGLELATPLGSTRSQSQEQVRAGKELVLGLRTTGRGLGARLPGPGVLAGSQFPGEATCSPQASQQQV